MHTQLSVELAAARQQEFSDSAAARRRRPGRSSISWEGVTVRLATSADRAALDRLAALDDADRPAEPVLLGVISQRPVAALSLSDGHVVADPFRPTLELIELLRLRARQLGAGERHSRRRWVFPALRF
jgi:hypothetical protein